MIGRDKVVTLGGEGISDKLIWKGTAKPVAFGFDGCAGALGTVRGSFMTIQEADGALLCAVDPVASIPLFYSSHGGRAYVSDDASAIAHAIGAPVSEPDAAEFLQAGYVTGERTLFEGVRAVPPGCCAIVRGGGVLR